MVKSRAEICREYRKRLKERDKEGYLKKKERERRRKNYVPSSMLSPSKQTERRRKVREAVNRYKRKKSMQTANSATGQEQAMDTSGYESVHENTEVTQNMVVALQFPRRSEGPRKRFLKELKSAKQTIAALKKYNIELSRKLKSEQRRRQRMIKRLQGSPRTPKSKAEIVMNEAGLRISGRLVVCIC